MKQYVPLTLEMLDQGHFLRMADADIGEAQKRLLAFVEEHGDKAEGAKAKLTIELTFAVENPADGLFSVKAQTKLSTPARPATVSMAISDETSDGPGLFVKISGSEAASPRQAALCTQEGEMIDAETGEVKK